ncbi:hypothetical protein CORC01_08564 [Colletotrichum orchidophilum]|uniref:Uncharacterized protein n=1 Tax=Colletotrichum orchidophilum TaxID=1209926 RepID=A0A1G4B466_9PEZI|nr:uncharacterized protein CORC01_08564 [Colletotrichum orchidophilum]OHE96187.1 hypothetical protein CORC01_08564 [Colletotrichum orchidophilum]
MADPTPPKPASARPPMVTLIFTAIFLLFSAAGFSFIRIQPGHTPFVNNLAKLVEAGKLQDGSSRLCTTYTGLHAIDVPPSFLVASFAQGPLRLDQAARLQQIHFLPNFLPRCVHAAWAALYRTIGGGVIIPLYHLAYTLISTKQSYLVSGGEVPLPFAKALLPGSPTHLSRDNRRNQPLLVNAGIWPLACTLYKKPSSPNQYGKPMVPSSTRRLNPGALHRTYNATMVVSAASHFYITSTNPTLTFINIFLPTNAISMGTVSMGLHQIFQ